MTLHIDSTIALNNGLPMPRFGLGVYQTGRGAPTVRAVKTALEVGYRLVDTARLYRNEEEVGEAVRDSGLPREAMFVTTKLWNNDHGFDRALKAGGDSLARLGLEYIDLYLIHWPVARIRADSWRALEVLYEEGVCRAIGVSNYTIPHLEELMASCRIPPMVNQVEASPFLTQQPLRAWCRRHGVVVESYSPLTKGTRLRHPVLREMAPGYGRTTAQLLIRWALQHDMVVIPKAANPDHIRENADVFDFEISEADMTRLDGLEQNLHTSWDPSDQP